MAPIRLSSIEKMDNSKIRKTPTTQRPNVLPTARILNNKYTQEGIGKGKKSENNRRHSVPRDKIEKKQPHINSVKTSRKGNSLNLPQKEKATPTRNGNTRSTTRNSSPRIVPKEKQIQENQNTKNNSHQNGNSPILAQHDRNDTERSMTQKEKQIHNLRIFEMLSIKGSNTLTQKVCQYTRQMASNANGVMYTQSVSLRSPNPPSEGVEQNNHQPVEEKTVPEEKVYSNRLEEVVNYVANHIVDSIRAVTIHNGERIRSEFVHEGKITDPGKEAIIEYIMKGVGDTIKRLLDVLERKEKLFFVLHQLVNEQSFIQEDDVADIISRISEKCIHPPTLPTDQNHTRNQDMENIQQIAQAETVHWSNPPSGNPPSHPEGYVANDSNDQWKPVSEVDSRGGQDNIKPTPLSVANWNMDNTWQISPQEPRSVKSPEYAPGVTIRFPISCGEAEPLTINWRPPPCQHSIPCSSRHLNNRPAEARYAGERTPQWPPRATSRTPQTPVGAKEPPQRMNPNTPAMAGKWSNNYQIDFSEWLALGRRLFGPLFSGSGASGYPTPDSSTAEMREEPRIPAHLQPTFNGTQGGNLPEFDNLRTLLQNGPESSMQATNVNQANW